MKWILRKLRVVLISADDGEDDSAEEVARLRKEVETYKQAYETTRDDRDRILREDDGKDDPAEEVARLRKEVETYKQAYETTLDDRDRILRELEIREHFNSSSAPEIADPQDAGNFRLDFAQFKNKDPHHSDALAAEWEALYDSGRYEDLQLSILDKLKVRIAYPLGPEYFKPYVTYYLANFHAQRGAYDQASKYAAEIEFSAPPDGTDFLPFALRQASQLVQFQQEQAIERGEPSVIIISMQKSASAHLSNAIARALRLPVLRIGVGDGLPSVAVPRWARQVAFGGAITHDHMRALPCNLNALCGVGKIWVQLRDPRDATWSLMNMTGAPDQKHSDKSVRAFIGTTRALSEWTRAWVSASAKPGMDISFIEYGDFIQSPLDIVTQIIGSEKAQLAAPYLAKKGSNFRSGHTGQWRSICTKEVCAEVDALVDGPLAERFGWQH